MVEHAFIESGKLKKVKSKSIYYNSLALFLIKLSCSDKNLARGIINHRDIIGNGELSKKFVGCLISIKDNRAKSGNPVCPGVTALSKTELSAKMERVTSAFKNAERRAKMLGARLENTHVEATFPCEAQLFEKQTRAYRHPRMIATASRVTRTFGEVLSGYGN